MRLAKEAAVLRAVGESNPDPKVAELERKLLEATRGMGIGPMGSRGINAVMGVHIETALTHTAALPVAVNAQCLVGRRWIASIAADGTVTYRGDGRMSEEIRHLQLPARRRGRPEVDAGHDVVTVSGTRVHRAQPVPHPGG